MNFSDWTLEDVKKHNERIKQASNIAKTNYDLRQSILSAKVYNLTAENKKTKYKANKCVYNGIRFDSQKERDRYIQLLSMEKEDIIENLQLQVPFVLQDAFEIKGRKIRPIKYIADFTYVQDGEEVIEDVKGKRTQVYDIKKKMFMYRYKKYIKEV